MFLGNCMCLVSFVNREPNRAQGICFGVRVSVCQGPEAWYCSGKIESNIINAINLLPLAVISCRCFSFFFAAELLTQSLQREPSVCVECTYNATRPCLCASHARAKIAAVKVVNIRTRPPDVDFGVTLGHSRPFFRRDPSVFRSASCP